MAQRAEEEKKRTWAQWAESELTKCRNSRHAFEQQWFLNLAFCAGKQYVLPTTIAGSFRLTTPRTPHHRVKLVINKIRIAVRTECSKLTTSKPIPTVMPSTNEDEDFTAAAVAEQILKSQFATADFEKMYRSWIWWGVVCGNSFLKMWWDGAAKDYDAMTLPKKPTFPGSDTEIPDEIIAKIPQLQQMLQTPMPSQGKICTERITPFHIYVPDLMSEDINEQPYVIHVMTKSPEWVKSKFGIDATPDARASNTILDSATIITKGAEDHLDSVLVKEVWVKPGGSKYFPQGGMFTVINGKVAQGRDTWPYPFPQYPFYKYDGIPTGGFYSDSVIVDLIPVQKEYNKKRSMALEIQNTMGKPHLLYQHGSLDPRKISSEPGQAVGYKAGYEKPEVMPPAEVPQSFINEIEKLQQEFDDLSGQHEISRGQTSLSSLTSGTAIAYLQEQDDAKLNYQVASIEAAVELLGKHYLTFAAFYWDADRLVKVTGKNNNYETIHWKQGMLKGNTDVKTQTGSALPYSKAAKQALLGEWMMNGWIDPGTGLEMMDFGGINKALEDSLVDKRAAMRENLKMVDLPDSALKMLLEPAPGPNGEPPIPGPPDERGKPTMLNGDGSPFMPQSPIPVNSWDNHNEHIKWHNHFRKSQEFEMLSEFTKKAFELHVQTHEAALMKAQMGFGGNVIGGPPPQEQGFDDGPPDPDSPEGGGINQPPNNEAPSNDNY